MSHSCFFFRVLLLSLGFFSQALAVDGIKLSGFGTLGLSCFNDKSADFIYNVLPQGPGRTQECDFGLDTILGVQSNANLTERVDVVAQLTSQRTPYNNFKPEFSILNLRLHPEDALTVRLGRVSNPLFLDSDHRQVHFALPGMRPQSELYGLSPVFFLDGIDVAYRRSMGSWSFEYRAGYHWVDFDVPASNSPVVNTVNVRDDYLLGMTAEHGAWLFKIGYGQGRTSYITSQTDAIFKALRMISSEAAALADQLDFRDTQNRTYAVGMRCDQDEWLIQSEIGARTYSKSYQRNRYAGYVMLGYHIGLWMPYTIFARTTTVGPTNDSRAGPMSVQVTGLLAATRQDQSSFTLGASRELGKSLILKGQVQWIQPDRGNSGNSLINRSANYNLADPQLDQLLSINLNFIF